MIMSDTKPIYRNTIKSIAKQYIEPVGFAGVITSWNRTRFPFHNGPRVCLGISVTGQLITKEINHVRIHRIH